MPKDLLTIDETAEMLRVSSKTVYRKIDSIPGAFKLFGTWRIDREILLSGLKELATKPKSKAVIPSSDRHGLL